VPVLFADGDGLLPQWLVIALAVCSGPVAVFGTWASNQLWKLWRARRGDQLEDRREISAEWKKIRRSYERTVTRLERDIKALHDRTGGLEKRAAESEAAEERCQERLRVLEARGQPPTTT
jgi:hypothetical protein